MIQSAAVQRDGEDRDVIDGAGTHREGRQALAHGAVFERRPAAEHRHCQTQDD